MIVDRRMARPCPSCPGPMVPFTDGYGRTRLRSHCTRWCRLARVTALAAGPRPGSFEPAQIDDRDQFRRHVPFGGNAA